MTSVHVRGNAADIPKIAREQDVGLLLYAIANIDQEQKEQILDLCHLTPAHLVLIPDILQTIRNYFDPETASKPYPPTPAVDPSHWLARLARLDELVTCREWEQAQIEIKQMRQILSGD